MGFLRGFHYGLCFRLDSCQVDAARLCQSNLGCCLQFLLNFDCLCTCCVLLKCLSTSVGDSGNFKLLLATEAFKM